MRGDSNGDLPGDRHRGRPGGGYGTLPGDPVGAQLRRSLRTSLRGVPASPAIAGAPVDAGPDSPVRRLLDELGALVWELPMAAGGLELGLAAGVIVCEELGRAAAGNPYRGGALLVDAALAIGRADLVDRVVGGAGVAVGGLAALPPGTGVAAAPAAGGWALTGTAGTDGRADLLAVACRAGGTARLAVLPGTAAGLRWTAGWPAAVALSAAPADLLGELAAGAPVLDRARVRQAGYLLGLAAGMVAAAVDHTGRRRQFGGRIRDLQAVGFPLARALVALRVARLGTYRAAALLDAGLPSTAPAEALAAAAEVLTGTARVSMQACGVRAMTPELPLHRYYRLATAEAAALGRPGPLWQEAGAARLAACAAPVPPGPAVPTAPAGPAAAAGVAPATPVA